MQSNSNCIREASNACCFHSCCPKIPPPPPSAAAPRRDFVFSILSTLDAATSFTNHESLPSSKHLLLTLTNALPNFLNTVLADSIRAREYHHLSLSGHVCLDYAGHGLFSYAQVAGPAPPPEAPSTSTAAPAAGADFFELEYSSMNLTSCLLYGGAEPSGFHAAAKRRILRYMNLPEDDYSVVFTANQPSAFKILAHSYPFRSHPGLVTVYDHDNEAAEAMADAARRGGARARSASFSWPSLRINSRKLRKILKNKNSGLFVFPLQSRVSGARYPYQWMNMAREKGWHVLLDATPLAAKEMETLGLSLFQPDFVTCSFFNIFGGNPSGLCCLFVKKSTIPLLNRSSTNIGIVNLIPPKNSDAIDGDEIVETDNMVEASASFRGLDHADELGLILISSRLRYLVNWVVHALQSLRHPGGNGVALVRVYGPRVRVDRGAAVAFNVFDWKGEKVEPGMVQKLADRNNVSLSVGLLKNVCFSGEGETLVKRRGKGGCVFDVGEGVGVVSASLGMLSNFEDVYRFWAFVSRFLDADFVEKEKWRYTALNQTTVEV